MKITCDNCGAKYSIADDKVRGKVFKIRCKKCSHIVVVRGTSGGADDVAAEPATSATAPQPAAPAVAPAAMWHIVIGREQVGPCTPDEVRRRFNSGEINAESYVWREGFVDWLRLNAVDEFADLVEPPGAVAVDAQATDNDMPAEGGFDYGSGVPEMGVGQAAASLSDVVRPAVSSSNVSEGSGALFAAGSAQVAAQPSASAGSNGQSGLFAGVASAGGGHRPMFGEDDDDDGGDLAHPQMTGQRGENSVLFSLANLQALAIGEGAGTSPKQTSTAGRGSESSSGLIDIRAMAAATSTASAAADDDLPMMGGFSGPVAAAPVLLPSGGADRPKWLVPTIAGLAVVLLGTVVLLVLLLMRDSQPQVALDNAVASRTDQSSVGAAVEATPMVPGEDPAREQERAKAATQVNATEETASKQEQADDGQSGTKSEATASADQSDDKDPHRGRRAARRRPSRRRGAKPAPPPARRPSDPTPDRPARQGPRDELDKLLDSSMNARRARRGSSTSAKGASSAGSNLPQQLSRSDIVAGMRPVKARVQSCYDRYKVPGLADVRLKIGNDGRVRSAVVKGLFAGTPTGACVRSAVMAARFPRFKSSIMSITYPFMLR